MDLPDSLLASTPRLLVLYGWALALACQLDAADELIQQLGRFMPAPNAQEQDDLLAQWLALSGIIARGRGQVPEAERYCSEALAPLPGERCGPRLMCLFTLANLAMTKGDLWRARGLNREALELAQRVDNPLFEGLAHAERARVLHARGEDHGGQVRAVVVPGPAGIGRSLVAAAGRDLLRRNARRGPRVPPAAGLAYRVAASRARTLAGAPGGCRTAPACTQSVRPVRIGSIVRGRCSGAIDPAAQGLRARPRGRQLADQQPGSGAGWCFAALSGVVRAPAALAARATDGAPRLRRGRRAAQVSAADPGRAAEQA